MSLRTLSTELYLDLDLEEETSTGSLVALSTFVNNVPQN